MNQHLFYQEDFFKQLNIINNNHLWLVKDSLFYSVKNQDQYAEITDDFGILCKKLMMKEKPTYINLPIAKEVQKFAHHLIKYIMKKRVAFLIGTTQPRT